MPSKNDVISFLVGCGAANGYLAKITLLSVSPEIKNLLIAGFVSLCSQVVLKLVDRWLGRKSAKDDTKTSL